ncbi:hypothetical protein OG501_26165 [Streptomyces niveus]|uniref:hypothetical protein n=1 Tax=Streptomyces niveus TaxID=193462 RepID=UPI00386C1770
MRRAFPYPVLAGDVNLRVEKVLADNTPLVLNLFSDVESVIALHSLKRDWKEVLINLVVRVDAQELAAGGWNNPSCLAVVRNRKTNVRLTFPLMEEETGVWRGDVELRRGEHLGRCEIDAWVVAEVGASTNRLIGRAQQRWSADFEAKQPTRQRSIKMVWKNFADHPFLMDFRDDPWMLDAEASEPVLYLNSAIDGFRAVLDGTSGAERKLVREIMATQIASEAWTAMFNTALYSIHENEDGIAQWPGGWQEEVLRKMLPHVFPDLKPDESLAEVVSRRTGGEGGSDLHARIMHAATLASKKQKAVASTVRTLTRIENGGGSQ